MNLEKKREEEYCLMSMMKRSFSWLSLIAPPLLHILGFRFLHLFLTSAALFFSSFFLFPISLSPSSIQPLKQDKDRNYVAIPESITTKSENNLETTTKEDDEDEAIPDDESLIELSLPCGRYVGHHYTSNKNNNLCLHNKVQADVKLIDLFTELNDFMEEDNLIEIDISIGSIKYSRFEIKA